MALVCKICGYKQHDEETISYYKKKYPGIALRDIPYVCGACFDKGYSEDEDPGELITIDIYYSDLTDDAQKRVLAGYGLSDPKDANWDIFPLFVLYPDIVGPEDFDE